MVLTGMPEIESVSPVLTINSRIDPRVQSVSDADIQVLLEQRWRPVGVHLLRHLPYPRSPPQ
jgi:hypothetical protein